MTDIQHLAYSAQASLRPYVRRILHGSSDRPVKESFLIPPTGSLYLTLIFGDPLYIRLGEGGYRRAPRLFVGGQVRQVLPECLADGRVDMLGTEFTPSGFYRLFQVDCCRLTDRFTDLSELLPEVSHELEALVLGVSDVASRLGRLQGYLQNRVADAVETPYVDLALDVIERHDGRIGVEALARKVCISPRQLQRRFLKCVGVGPKHYAKAVQIKHAFAALQSCDTGELQSIAHAAGYYDQAHFIHDFQRLVGRNPAAFLRHRDAFLDTFLSHCSERP